MFNLIGRIIALGAVLVVTYTLYVNIFSSEKTDSKTEPLLSLGELDKDRVNNIIAQLGKKLEKKVSKTIGKLHKDSETVKTGETEKGEKMLKKETDALEKNKAAKTESFKNQASRKSPFCCAKDLTEDEALDELDSAEYLEAEEFVYIMDPEETGRRVAGIRDRLKRVRGLLQGDGR